MIDQPKLPPAFDDGSEGGVEAFDSLQQAFEENLWDQLDIGKDLAETFSTHNIQHTINGIKFGILQKNMGYSGDESLFNPESLLEEINIMQTMHQMPLLTLENNPQLVTYLEQLAQSYDNQSEIYAQITTLAQQQGLIPLFELSGPLTAPIHQLNSDKEKEDTIAYNIRLWNPK